MKLKLGLLLTLIAANVYCDNNSNIFGSSAITQKSFDAYLPVMRALVNFYSDLSQEERAWIFEKMHLVLEKSAQEVNANPELALVFAKSYSEYKNKLDFLMNETHYIHFFRSMDIITNFFKLLSEPWQNLTNAQKSEFKDCLQKAFAVTETGSLLANSENDYRMIMQISDKAQATAQKEGYPAFESLLYNCTMKYNVGNN